MFDAIITSGPFSATYGPHRNRFNIFSETKHIGTFYPGSGANMDELTRAVVEGLSAAGACSQAPAHLEAARSRLLASIRAEDPRKSEDLPAYRDRAAELLTEIYGIPMISAAEELAEIAFLYGLSAERFIASLASAFRLRPLNS